MFGLFPICSSVNPWSCHFTRSSKNGAAHTTRARTRTVAAHTARAAFTSDCNFGGVRASTPSSDAPRREPPNRHPCLALQCALERGTAWTIRAILSPRPVSVQGPRSSAVYRVARRPATSNSAFGVSGGDAVPMTSLC